MSPDRTATVVEALVRRARDTPDALAFTADRDALTCGALLADSGRLAGRIAARGLSRGERCALVLPTGLDVIRALFACQAIGVVPVVVSPDQPPAAILTRLRLVRCALALTTGHLAMRLSTASAPCPCPVFDVAAFAREPGVDVPIRTADPADLAFFQLTSGTTGEPRAAMVTHHSLRASTEGTLRRLEIGASDVFATWLPLHYALGLVRFVFTAMFAGCPSHLIRPTLGAYRPWLELMSRVQATVTSAPDSAYRLAARTVRPEGLDLRALRVAGSGGEPVRAPTIDAFERRFALPRVVVPAYGLAEATLVVTSTAPGDPVRVDARGVVSCGRALDAVTLRVVDEAGHTVSAGVTGQLLVRGDPVFAGYFDDQAATREVLRDGWLHTGDIGYLDADGHLFIAARARALIKRGGASIAPREVEDAVAQVPGVETAAALGVVLSPVAATEDLVVVAELTTDALLSASNVAQRVSAAVHDALGFVPGRVVLVGSGAIPRTAAGKLRYDELRSMVASGAFDALGVEGSTGGAAR